MADLVDEVDVSISESRSLVLGVQILLGFQYDVLFQSGFAAAPLWRRALVAPAFSLLLAAFALITTPAAFQSLAERGAATRRTMRVRMGLRAPALFAFVAALALDVALATAGALGAPLALGLSGLTAVLLLALLFVVEAAMGRPAPQSGSEREAVPADVRVRELLKETRVVLPGVQALLGFQLTAFFLKPFQDLPADLKAVHTFALAGLLLAMGVLMSPAGFHLGELARPSRRVRKIGAAMVLAGLAALSLALSADLFVALAASGAAPEPLAGFWAGLAAAGLNGLWFGYPLLSRRRERRASPGPAPDRGGRDPAAPPI